MILNLKIETSLVSVHANVHTGIKAYNATQP